MQSQIYKYLLAFHLCMYYKRAYINRAINLLVSKLEVVPYSRVFFKLRETLLYKGPTSAFFFLELL
jgi:hypothetical protein